MAPGLVGRPRLRLKDASDMRHTIVSEWRKRLSTQSPEAFWTIVKVHSKPATLLDFAGGGSFAGLLAHGRRCILVDKNPEAMAVMEKRFAGSDVEW